MNRGHVKERAVGRWRSMWMHIKVKDDRGKPIAVRLGTAMQRQRDKKLVQARKDGLVVVVATPRETLTPRGATLVLGWFIGVMIWMYACAVLLSWLFEVRNGQSIFEDALDRLARQTSSFISYTVVIIGLVMMFVCIHLPPLLAALKLFAPSMWRDRLRRHLYMRRCPTCDYVLNAVTSQPDGYTVCPECGAAWKIPEGAMMPEPVEPTSPKN